ncbi:hypothetical protein C9374_008540 [Naegleria lovaniensis]|uniref:Uncharacterized protein n=1 Tax=Naegleria lovaniensis TaxID=51637 RepID=A0AA88GFB2_NAELO|nr:uncharacterized protein C9374_008540 [Naegleria lovaniensis]KAG2378397.1 hypothetical protein C9374_008540 [Naegleria lovaniensis]
MMTEEDERSLDFGENPEDEFFPSSEAQHVHAFAANEFEPSSTAASSEASNAHPIITTATTTASDHREYQSATTPMLDEEEDDPMIHMVDSASSHHQDENQPITHFNEQQQTMEGVEETSSPNMNHDVEPFMMMMAEEKVLTTNTILPQPISSSTAANTTTSEHSPSSVTAATSTAGQSLATTNAHSIQNTSFEQNFAETALRSSSKYLEDDIDLERVHFLNAFTTTMFENVMRLGISHNSNTTPFETALSAFPKSFLKQYEPILSDCFSKMQRTEPTRFIEDLNDLMSNYGLKQKLNALDRTVKINDHWVYFKRNPSENESKYVVVTPDMKQEENTLRKKNCLASLKSYLETKRELLRQMNHHKQLINQMNEQIQNENSQLIKTIQEEYIPTLQQYMSPLHNIEKNLDNYYRSDAKSQQSQQSSSSENSEKR